MRLASPLSFLTFSLTLLPLLCRAQFNGKVGPTTSLASKSAHLCNVLDYGAKADNQTDIGPAISSAFKDCVLKNLPATLYIPPGTFSIASTVQLVGGKAWAMRIDGLLIASYAGTISGNILIIKNTDDLEVYSSNGLGAIQAQGYLWRINVRSPLPLLVALVPDIADLFGSIASQNGLAASKPRIFRVITSTNFIVRNLILVDAGAFHLVLDNNQNFEVANMTIRGPSVGGSDGIDVSGTNYYIHDSDVSNRDECVSVKSPSRYGTIARMRCNQSGGLSIGSLQQGAIVENIVFDTIDVYESTQGLMIKTYPSAAGTDTGYVRNIVASNFRLWRSTYTAYIQQYWQSKTTPEGAGVQISNVTFDNWSGSNVLGYQRGTVMMVGSKFAPPHDITVKNFNMWSETVLSGIGELNKCSDAYGKGSCLATPSKPGVFPAGPTATETLRTAPAGWKKPAEPTWGVKPYPVYAPIPVYEPKPSFPLTF